MGGDGEMPPLSARPKLDVDITLRLPKLEQLWQGILNSRSSQQGVDGTARSHETDLVALLRAARRFSKLLLLVKQGRRGGGLQREYPVGFPTDNAEAAGEWRRFQRLKTEGLAANRDGDVPQALRRHQAALIYPSCANVLSAANMHHKLGHPTLAAPPLLPPCARGYD